MTTEMILDNENMMLEDPLLALPWVTSLDNHYEHIEDHLGIKTKNSLEHIKEHLYQIAWDECDYRGTLEEFKDIMFKFINWDYAQTHGLLADLSRINGH